MSHFDKFLSVPFLHSFDAEHESDDLEDLCPAGAVQTVAVAEIVVLAVIRSQFVAMHWRIRMPEIDAKAFLYQQQVPVVDDADRSLPLVLVLILKISEMVWHANVRYRGIVKNLTQMHTLFNLANLYHVRYQLLAA